MKDEEYLFSKELRDKLQPFSQMDVRDCLANEDFLRTLCKHAGMSDERFNEILNRNK